MNALRHRNFRLLFGARTISFFGTNLVPIAVAFAILDLGGSVSAVGLAFGARTFAQIAALLDGATYAVSALLLAAMRLPALAKRLAKTHPVRDLVEGWNAFIEHTWVWLLAAWIAVFFLISYAPFFVLGPYLAKQEMGGAGAWATVLTGEAIGSLLGGLAALRLRPARPMLVCVLVFTLSSIQLVLLAEGAPFGTIAIAASIAGFAFAFGSVIYETALQRWIAPDKLSRVASFDWLVSMSVLPIGYALAGPIANAIGISTYLWIGAIWVVVSALAVAMVPSVRDLQTDGAPEHEAGPAPAVT